MLEEVGVVSHTHLGHRSSTYHLADHADHVHLVCLSCGTVIQSAVATADPFVGNLLTRHGSVAEASSSYLRILVVRSTLGGFGVERGG